MEDNILLEKIKQAQNDIDKMDMIRLIQDEKIKETAIYLLEDDNNKLLISETLKKEAAKARLYGRLIRKDEMIDDTIEEVRKLKSQKFAALVLNGMSDSNYIKKANAIADLFITSKEADDDSREKVSDSLKRIYRKIHMKNPDYTFLDFLHILENDYSIASVIANVSNSPNLGEFSNENPTEGLPSSIEEKKSLLVAIRDDNVREQIGLVYSSRYELINKLDSNNVSLINLPEDMTIGVELEAEGEIASVLNGLRICDKWQAKGDASLEKGIEVVSPILHDSLEDMTDLSMVCQIMKQCELSTSDRCGGHIHIGARYLDTKEAFGNFLTLWLANEESIYRMCNASGESFREGTDHFAKPISLLYENGDENIFSDISNAKTRDELVSIIKTFQKGHYNGLNTDNINSKETDTIEFRISNGTLNFEEIQNNIRLYGRLMQRSKEVSLLQAKLESGQEVSEIEQKKINDFENLCNQQYKKEEKGQMLIDFLFEEDERETYISRYNSSRDNSEPLKKMFSKDAYKKLYTVLKPKDKNFSAVISSLKDSKTNEKEDEEIEQ